MIESYYCQTSLFNDFEVLHDDQHSYSVDIWCYGDNPFGDCILELRAYRAFKKYKTINPGTSACETIGVGKPFYCYTVSKRTSFYQNWPRTLARNTEHKTLDSAIECAYDALLAYDPSIERF